MVIINTDTVITALALSVVVQYIVEKIKYGLPIFKKDKLYSIIIALIAFIFSIIIVWAFNVEMFNSNVKEINYLLTAVFIASGSSTIHELINSLSKNIGDEK